MRRHEHRFLIGLLSSMVSIGIGCSCAIAQGGGVEFFGGGDEFSKTSASGNIGLINAGVMGASNTPKRAGESALSPDPDGYVTYPYPYANTNVVAPRNKFVERLKPERGRWGWTVEGDDIWIPDQDDDFGSDAFDGKQDAVPPPRSSENIGTACDAFSPAYFPRAALQLPKAKRCWPADRRNLRVYVSSLILNARNGRVKTLIEECMTEWCLVSNNFFSFQLTSDFKNADVYFIQRDTLCNEWADHERCYSKKGLDMVQISLLEQTVKYMPERRLKAILLHQAGHTFGLIDHLASPDSAMSLAVADVNTTVNHLSERDRKELTDFYDLPHGSTAPESAPKSTLSQLLAPLLKR